MQTSTVHKRDSFLSFGGVRGGFPDQLGSSTVISAGAGYAYQMFLNLPFGETMAEQRRNGALNNPYKFNGKELDTETGLYYYGARYYDPRISNWLSVDPLAEKTMTPYQYTYQNPVRFIDPDGKAPTDIIYQFKLGGGKVINYEYKNGAFYNMETGKMANYKDKATTSIHMMRTQLSLSRMDNGGDKILSNQVKHLQHSTRRHVIIDKKMVKAAGRVSPLNVDDRARTHNSAICEPYETLIQLDFSSTSIIAIFDNEKSDFELTAHEIRHVWDIDIGNYLPTKEAAQYDGRENENPMEIRAVVNGNRARALEGRNKKTTYDGKGINLEKLRQAEIDSNKGN